MAHDFIKDELALDSRTGQESLKIIMTLLGGMLLICAFIARSIYGEANSDVAHILAAIAAILLGVRLIREAIMDIIHGHMHMNELVALAVLAAFVEGWYLEAGSIAFFMIISVLIENRTALGAEASIESLIKITPTRAYKIVGGGEVEVEAKDLQKGEVVRVRPGDNIPADGRVVKGLSTVNQANITGESLPVDKIEGDEVFSGTINLTGAMDIEVTKAGEDTTLGRVKELILQAEITKTPLVRMINQYAAWYTPTILMLVFIVWFFISKTSPDDAVKRAITMLVVACPCPLILATPTAMVAALSAAARLGVLVKSVENLEAARKLTSMIFDKTGTLTTGQLEVTRLTPSPGVDGVDLIQTAASAEQNSRHPVAQAVCAVARKAKVKPQEATGFEEVAGKGVRAKMGQSWVLVGRGSWITGELIEQSTAQTINDIQFRPEAAGLSILFVVKDGMLLGWIGMEDNTRPEAAAAMDSLREMGMKRLIIVTGDRESVAKRVASQLHTEYAAEVLPHQKLEMIDELKGRGHNVAMVGDGVNDAPALKAGDISIAMGAAGSDVAIQSASIVINNNNLNRIPFLIRLSNKTNNIVKQNLLVGAGFIVLFEALAIGGQLNPILAAILHVLSSLVVIFNSARLVRAGEDIEHAEAKAAAASQKGSTKLNTESSGDYPDQGIAIPAGA